MLSNKIFRYFPVPELLNPDVVGISFSDLAIKAVSVPRNSKHYPVKTSFIPLNKGIVVGGIILDQEAFVLELRKISKNFAEEKVVFTVPDELVYVYKTEVALPKGGNIKESILFTLEENVPLSIDEAIVEFIPIYPKNKISEDKIRAVVTVCAKKDIEFISNIFDSAGFDAICAIPESQALVLSTIPQNKEGNVVIVHARENRIGIYMVVDRVINFATIRNTADDSYSTNFVDELQKFKEYWQSYEGEHFDNVEVYVCGDFKYAKDVVATLKSNSSISSKPIFPNIWTNIFNIADYTPNVSFEDSLSLAGATGASIINL